MIYSCKEIVRTTISIIILSPGSTLDIPPIRSGNMYSLTLAIRFGDYLKFDGFAITQRTESIGMDGGMMYEYVWRTIIGY